MLGRLVVEPAMSEQQPSQRFLTAAALQVFVFSGLSLLNAQEQPADTAQPAVQRPAADKAAPKVLTIDDYGRWNRLGDVALSPTGQHVTYSYRPNDGDARFFVAEAATGRVVREVVNGGSVRFSDDGKWVGYLVRPKEAEAKKLQKQKKPVRSALELFELPPIGDSDTAIVPRRFESVRSFRFADEGVPFVAVHKHGVEKAEHDGSDLVLLELRLGQVQNIGNVSGYAFSESGSYLAYTVDAADDAGNGVYLLTLRQGGEGAVPAIPVASVLDSGTDSTYRGLVWQRNDRATDADLLAVLRGRVVEEDGAAEAEPAQKSGAESKAGETKPKGKKFEAEENELLVFAPAAGWSKVFDPKKSSRFPGGHVLSEFRAPSWSDDGSRVFVGVRAQAVKGVKKPRDDQANVEVWHWKDERVQSIQKVRASRDRRRTDLAVVHLTDRSGRRLDDPRFVALTDDRMRTVTTTDHPGLFVGRDDSQYRGDMSVDRGLADYVTVDLWTGERRPIVQKVRRAMGISPDGRFFVWSVDGAISVHDLERGRSVPLSRLVDVDFTNREAGRTSEPSTYGIAGWAADGRTVILNHRYDLWAVPLVADEAEDGELERARNLTSGVGGERAIRFRLADLDPDLDTFDLTKPFLVSAYGDRTKESGYFWGMPGKAPQPLRYVDAMVGGLRKAEDAERVVWTRQTAVEFPDLWTSTIPDAGKQMPAPRKLTEANPQQSEYAWTPGRILFDYEDARGNELQGTLTLPAGYEKGRRYPTLVYFYEKMSQRHHQYSMPAYDDRPHMSTYASAGYVVIQPDIVYEPGKPGSSAVDDVTSAVHAAIELGMVDPDRIGLQGHSWGGYQSSFIVTQTDLFACVVTGAPLTNLVSMHNVLYKRTGSPNAGLIQWGQGRMGASPWDDWQGYLDESPVYHARSITTPFMILHGTADGAVDWNQGLEFYIAAKRLGKQVILLSYPDEPHHLRKKPNQIDFQVRMQQYFDHYLKGVDAPAWLEHGVDYIERDR